MDGARFDSLTKSLTTGSSRRRLLRGAIGAAAAGLFGAIGAERAAAGCRRNGTVCSTAKPSQCCSGYCDENANPSRGVGKCAPRPTGPPCNKVTCKRSEFCCNESCSICALRGGACTQQACDDGGGQPCNKVTCGPGEYCCDFFCSTCAPNGGACPEICMV